MYKVNCDNKIVPKNIFELNKKNLKIGIISLKSILLRT